MWYPPLPRSAFPVVLTGTLVLLLWITWGSFTQPESLWAPGDLNRYHAAASCAQCHAPFDGATASRCIGCHSPDRFVRISGPSAGVHLDVIHREASCVTCHTEHRGLDVPVTDAVLDNPHGDFVFAATGTTACRACHVFTSDALGVTVVLDTAAVRTLTGRGEGAHKPGKFADCLRCHVGGGVELDDAR